MCFGLLTADSLNKNDLSIFSDKETAYILGHAADLFAVLFLLIPLSRYRPVVTPTPLNLGPPTVPQEGAERNG